MNTKIHYIGVRRTAYALLGAGALLLAGARAAQAQYVPAPFLTNQTQVQLSLGLAGKTEAEIGGLRGTTNTLPSIGFALSQYALTSPYFAVGGMFQLLSWTPENFVLDRSMLLDFDLAFKLRFPLGAGYGRVAPVELYFATKAGFTLDILAPTESNVAGRMGYGFNISPVGGLQLNAGTVGFFVEVGYMMHMFWHKPANTVRFFNNELALNLGAAFRY